MRWEPDRICGEHARERVPLGPPHGGRVLLDGRADRGEVVFKQCHGFDIISDTSALTFNGRSSGAQPVEARSGLRPSGAPPTTTGGSILRTHERGPETAREDRVEIPCAENL